MLAVCIGPRNSSLVFTEHEYSFGTTKVEQHCKIVEL